jgi:hypothetical protein
MGGAGGAGVGVVLPVRRRGGLGLRTRIPRGLLLMVYDGFVVLAYDVDHEFNSVVRF